MDPCEGELARLVFGIEGSMTPFAADVGKCGIVGILVGCNCVQDAAGRWNGEIRY